MTPVRSILPRATAWMRPRARSTLIPYIVMEYVEGHTLRTILSRGGHLPVSDALGYAEQLLGALQYSHSMGIIHRDIKPANIMVLDRTSEDIAKGQPGQIKVMDFGISRAIEGGRRGADQGERGDG